MIEILNILLDWIVDKKKWLIVVASTLIILSFVLFSHHGIIKRISLVTERSNLSESIKTEKMINDSLKIEHKKLENDLIEIERIAREKYGMLKPGEEVYFVRVK